MANTFLKATRIAAAALGLLQRDVVLPGLVWTDGLGDFSGAGGDTISIRVPARTQARTRQLRGARSAGGILQMDSLTETKVDVTLATDVYNLVPVTDEELTLDIADFGAQVLAPQVRAVAEGLENIVAAQMVGANYATTLTLDTDEPYNTLVDGRVALNKANVPMSDRVAVVGAEMEGYFLKSEHLNRVDESGTDSTLRDAVIGRVAGFGAVYVSNALPEDFGVVMHKTAFALAMRAPAVPAGAAYGSSQAYQGLAMRWIRDYDPTNAQDRSLLDCFAGSAVVNDGPASQTVTVTGAPSGGTFTLTVVNNQVSQTTSGIAYNATAATVQTAVQGLSNVGSGNATVSGGTGGPFTVNFTGALANAFPTLTANGASLTGGTSPGVTVASANNASFVRAVKLTL